MKKQFEKGNLEWYLKSFQIFESGLNGQIDSSLHRLRKKGIQSFEQLGYPTTKNEEWKYTSVAPIQSHDFELSDPYTPGSLNYNDIKKFVFEGLEDACLVFINGHYAEELSRLGGVKTKIRIKSLRQAFADEDDIVKQHFAAQANVENESFVSLNTAFVEDGIFIETGKNLTLQQPLQLLFIASTKGKPILTSPRNLIVVGKSSELTLVETYATIDEGTYFTNSVGEIVVGENAQLKRYRIQIEGENAYHISRTYVEQHRSSRFIDHSISLGGKLSRNDIVSVLKAENGMSVLNGLYIGNHDQHIDNHTTIDHARPHCESHELYKGILDDKAKGVFNGKIFVRPDAQKTNAIQSNNCILLSDEATIDTKPQLEIFADDVKCTHGATIGQLDEDAFFYMRSRGIEKSRARNLLIYAFVSEILDQVEVNSVREKVIDWFSEKLHRDRPE